MSCSFPVRARSDGDLSFAVPAPRVGSSIAALVLLFAAGCGDKSASNDAPAPATAATGSPLSAEPLPTAEPSALPPQNPHAGSWKAGFQTQRGEVRVPERVPYQTWLVDDGTVAAGKGEVSLTIAPDGEVTGEGAGALGALTIRGRFEEGELRAGVTPSDPSLPDGMTGVLTAALAGERIEGEIRAASPDARIVRVAPIALERQP